MRTTNLTKSETLNSQTWRLRLVVLFLSSVGGRRPPENLADAAQDCSTSEVFSPRTVLTENICRCVQQINKNCPATMAFLTTSTITLSCLASAAPQADSWWLGHVEPDDVVIADIGGQALDIFLHGPESAHKNGIVKSFSHTFISIHPCILLKQTKSKILNLLNMILSFTCALPVQCGGGRRPGSLADVPQDNSTTEAFSPTTILTENICRCFQHIFQHFPTTMAFLTASTISFSCLASAAPQADSWWLGHVEPDDVVIADIGGQALDIFLYGPEAAHKNGIVKTFTHTSIHIHPCTHLKEEKESKKKKKTSNMLNSRNMMPSFTGPLPVQCDGGRLSGSLAPAPIRRPCRLGQF